MTTSGNIATCEFRRPRANFGPRWTSTNTEDDFARAFAEVYNSKFLWFHSGSSRVNRFMAHEVPVNGFGIADLVALSWDDDVSGADAKLETSVLPERGFTVRAFETKLSDWKKGLMQTHRYKYFADAAVLVMPVSKFQLIEPHMATFRSLNIGFWTFNTANGVITPHSTPRPKRPASPQHRRKAITAVWQAIMQCRPTP